VPPVASHRSGAQGAESVLLHVRIDGPNGLCHSFVCFSCSINSLGLVVDGGEASYRVMRWRGVTGVPGLLALEHASERSLVSSFSFCILYRAPSWRTH